MTAELNSAARIRSSSVKVTLCIARYAVVSSPSQCKQLSVEHLSTTCQRLCQGISTPYSPHFCPLSNIEGIPIPTSFPCITSNPQDQCPLFPLPSLGPPSFPIIPLPILSPMLLWFSIVCRSCSLDPMSRLNCVFLSNQSHQYPIAL